jgi:hypothetical protein
MLSGVLLGELIFSCPSQTCNSLQNLSLCTDNRFHNDPYIAFYTEFYKRPFLTLFITDSGLICDLNKNKTLCMYLHTSLPSRRDPKIFATMYYIV